MIEIVPMVKNDWPRVADIYLQGIQTGHATFEQNVPDWPVWDSSHLKTPRLVCRWDGSVMGWAALSPVSERCVYGGVAEVSVYVDPRSAGQGIGTALLDELIRESETEGVWTLQAGIFPENTASIHIHLKCGFREVGLRQKLGQLNGTWRDVLLLERRSKVAGIV